MSDDVKQCRNVQRVERILWGKNAMRQFFARGVAKKLRCAHNELCVEKPRALSNFERVTYVHVRSRSENCFFLVFEQISRFFINQACLSNIAIRSDYVGYSRGVLSAERLYPIKTLRIFMGTSNLAQTERYHRCT